MMQAKMANPKAKDPNESGVQHCFYDFCKQTILHGWHYLADLVKSKRVNDSSEKHFHVAFFKKNSGVRHRVYGRRG